MGTITYSFEIEEFDVLSFQDNLGKRSGLEIEITELGYIKCEGKHVSISLEFEKEYNFLELRDSTIKGTYVKYLLIDTLILMGANPQSDYLPKEWQLIKWDSLQMMKKLKIYSPQSLWVNRE